MNREDTLQLDIIIQASCVAKATKQPITLASSQRPANRKQLSSPAWTPARPSRNCPSSPTFLRLTLKG